MQLSLNKRQYLELEKLSVGAFAPLRGFMHEDDFHSVVERMRLKDANTLEIITTIEDPEALAKPWTRTTTFARHADWTIAEYVCQQNNRNGVDENGKAKINLGR